ncbi:MAG: ATP-binding cassette domain-containing protein [Chloroflexi bacterium]|nr:ATP-binding cassette domain-containing protein [Chloroflexota bacterium]
MKRSDPWPDTDAAALRGVGALASSRAELNRLEGLLQAAPDWAPAQGLLAEIAWCQNKLTELATSWEHKLVVALVGPSGAGKSTLLNALAGRELSKTGLTRPTTRQVVVYARSFADAQELVAHCGSEAVQVEIDRDAPVLEYLVLVDTPDTNTLPENQRLLARLLERADLLLAVFPAHNPKLLDNIAFLRPYVERLPADAVVPVLNMVDRIPQEELRQAILPDFRRAMAAEWGLDNDRVFLVSALAAVSPSAFPRDEEPLHDVNQLVALQAWLVGEVDSRGQLADRRLARAEHLVALLKEHARELTAQHEGALSAAEEGLRELSRKTQTDLVEAVAWQVESGRRLDLHAAFYELIGQRWWGPVGWLVSLWMLAMRVSAFLGRRLSPHSGSGGRPSAAPAQRATWWSDLLARRFAQDWPPIAEALVAAGFGPATRELAAWQEWTRQHGENVAAHWAQAYQAGLEHLARRLSSWPLQLVWNAPTLAMVGWICYVTLIRFVAREYLSADFFRHAAIATAAVWLLSFVLLQVLITWTLNRSLGRQVSRDLAAVGDEGVDLFRGQLAAIRALSRQARP